MDLKDLKNKQVSADDRAKKLVESLGLTGDERSVVASLKKGDRFTLVGMSKVNLKPREGQAVTFVPVIFSTSTGATLGAKHFAGIDIDDDAPGVGSTPLENASFLVWCVDHEVEFVVRNLTSEDIEAKDNVPAYVKKTYRLEVESYTKDEK